jgi:hypothetical protein
MRSGRRSSVLMTALLDGPLAPPCRSIQFARKLADHAMDATWYAVHGELGEAAKTEAYLAELQRRLSEMQAEVGSYLVAG